LNETLEIARQICSGLLEAHAQGIVHRDLKPANIMLDRNGTVKIMDFGIARMVQRDGPMTGTIVGTPAYMAPEQAELKPLSACTDIYALGLLLYEMITGVAAFDGDTPVAVALKQIREYPKRPREIVSQISRAFDAVIMKCLQKDAAKRFQSVAELEIALARAANARPVRPWETALNRAITRAETEIRSRLHRGAERIISYFERQDWRRLIKLRDDPKAMLGVTGMVAALTVFLFFGGWKPLTINAQTVEVARRNSVAPVSAMNSSSSEFTTLPAQNSVNLISSHEVDLGANSRSALGNALSVDPGLPINNPGSEPMTPPSASPKPPRIAERVKSPARTEKRKAQSAAQNVAKLPTALNPTQVEILTSASSPKPASQELATIAAQPPEPAAQQANLATLPKSGSDEAKTPKLYVEVGTFKDETWANNAVEKLTQLGFHTVLVHKNLLWSQSYHVEVGPYTSQKDVAEARQSLSLQGFKARPVN
jgi:serine/threonine protein kinase